MCKNNRKDLLTESSEVLMVIIFYYNFSSFLFAGMYLFLKQRIREVGGELTCFFPKGIISKYQWEKELSDYFRHFPMYLAVNHVHFSMLSAVNHVHFPMLSAVNHVQFRHS